MCAPSPPPPPDYAAAAKEQGQANVDAAIATGHINNPNVNNPYGTQSVTWQGDQPTLTQTFSPEQQQLYDKQTQVKQLLAQLGISGAGALGDVIGQNVDFSGLPSAPGDASATRQKVIDAMMGRANTGFAQREDDTRSQLVAQGIRPGTEAYTREMTRIDQARNDARQQAELAGGNAAQQDYTMDSDRRRQALSELLAGRQTPLNEITALMSGSQVSNPFAGGLGYQAGGQVGAAPVFDAAKAQGQAAMDAYNAQAGAAGGMMSGLFSLGAAALPGMGAAAGWSDRRLKRNIHRIGRHGLGIGLYEWDYVWGEHATGVMADEVEKVMPAAVMTIGGYKAVDYAMIGR